MSAHEVTEKLVAEIDKETFDFIVVNFANCDMVGHTGVYSAIQKAVATIDDCVRDVVEAAKRHGYDTIIIADHGNADHALNDDGTPNPAHSLNPVPFIYVSDDKRQKSKTDALPTSRLRSCTSWGFHSHPTATGTNLIAD